MQPQTRVTIAAVAMTCALGVMAQSISDPVAEIGAMKPAEFDAFVAAIAQQTTAAAPIQSDAVTTITRAIYLPQIRTLNYTVQLAEALTAQAAAQNLKAGLCKGRSVLAIMGRGVTYQYSVTTPTQSYNITFKRADCQ